MSYAYSADYCPSLRDEYNCLAASHGASKVASYAYDFCTGQLVTLADLLRPRADTLFRKLLTRHLSYDPDQTDYQSEFTWEARGLQVAH